MANDETFSVTVRAMREVRDAAIAIGGAHAWRDTLDAFSQATRDAYAFEDEDALVDEACWVEAIHVADARLGDDGSVVRRVGEARASAVLAAHRAAFDEDPLRFLRI